MPANGAPAPAENEGMQPTATPSNDQSAATEPAVVSSSNIAENVIPQNAQTLQGWDSGGLNFDENGLAQYGDGSYATAPSSAILDPETGVYTANGINYAIGPNSTPDPDLAAMYDQINSMKASTDANTLSTINGIQSSYGNLISTAQSANKSNSKATNNAMLLSGTARYAPADAASMATVAMNKGLATISSLQSKENSAIASAQTAQSNNDQKLLDQYLTIAKQARQDKQTAAAALSKTLETATTKQATTQNTADIDSAIESQVAAGVTDPGTILTNLTAAGIPDVTAAQVSKSLGDLLTTTGATDVKDLTGDVKNFETLSQMPGGLPSSILALPQDQQLAAYINMVHAAAKGTGAVSGATISGGALVDADANPISVGMQANGSPDPADQSTFLASLPGGAGSIEATLIKGLANYSINPASLPTRLYSGQSGLTQAQAVALAAQYDPTYDSKQYATRAAMQKNVESGNYSQVITAANTAIQHLALLENASRQLPGNGGVSEVLTLGRNIPLLNSLANKLTTSTGGSSATNFNTEASAVGSELAKIYKGTGAPSEGEIEKWQSGLSPDMSNAQIQGSIQAAINLMAGKLSTLATNYESVMGTTGSFSILTPASIRTLEGLGIDPSMVDPTYDDSTDVGGSQPDDLLDAGTSGDSTDISSSGNDDTSSFFANSQ